MLRAFNEWWRQPLRTVDRVGAMGIGAFGGVWIGVLGRMFLGPMPVAFSTLGYWALGSIIVGAVLGIFFPRVVRVVLYPFALFGVGSN